MHSNKGPLNPDEDQGFDFNAKFKETLFTLSKNPIPFAKFETDVTQKEDFRFWGLEKFSYFALMDQDYQDLHFSLLDFTQEQLEWIETFETGDESTHKPYCAQSSNSGGKGSDLFCSKKTTTHISMTGCAGDELQITHTCDPNVVDSWVQQYLSPEEWKNGFFSFFSCNL